jgi:hypothetical protein
VLWLAVLGIALCVAAREEKPQTRPVSLHVENAALGDVLAELARASGNAIDVEPTLRNKTISLRRHESQFWPTLDALAATAGGRIDLYARSGRLRIVNGKSAAPISHDGLFRVALRRISATRDFEIDAVHYVAQLEVAWEPRVEPLLLETRPRGLNVQVGGGEQLPDPAEGSSLAPVDGKLALTFEVPLPAVAREIPTLAKLEGELAVIAPTRMVRFDFGPLTELARAPVNAAILRRSEGEMRCSLTRVVVDRERITLQVRLQLPPGGPSLESYQSWIVNNEMALVRGRQRQVARNYQLESSNPRDAVVSYHFTDPELLKDPAGWKVEYRTPAGLCTLPFRFSFANVRLP